LRERERVGEAERGSEREEEVETGARREGEGAVAGVRGTERDGMRRDKKR